MSSRGKRVRFQGVFVREKEVGAVAHDPRDSQGKSVF